MTLETSQLCCGYTKDKPVVRDISFQVSGGQVCCILGHNGVGKSTLFKTLLRLLPPVSGKVYLDGEDISGWSPRRMASKAAYVSQSHTPPFPYLVEEMVMLGRMGRLGLMQQPGEKDRAVVDALLKELAIDHLRKKPYTDISGGERQLVMVAKALAQEPELLVLDEPTANLDYGNKVLVLDTIQYLADRGICVIFTTHDPEHALLLQTQTLLLLHGAPAIFGPAAAVVTEKNLKAAYHATIRVVEIVDDAGKPVRVCLPLINQRERTQS